MATRYWVGGAGNWSSTTKWSTSSGGASGASVPTSVDDAVFDANSGGKFTATVDTAQSVNSLTITPSSGAGLLTISLAADLTTGALTTTGTAGNNRIFFTSATYGIAKNFIVSGTVSISDCDFRGIYVTGTSSPISGTRIGNRGECRGITFSTPKTVYWNLLVGGSWTDNAWATSSGGAVSTDNFPLPQDTAIIVNAGLNTSNSISLSSAIAYTGTVDMSGRTNAMSFSFGGGSVTVYGNWVTGSGTSYINTNILTFSGGTTQTITSAGKTFSCPITVDTYGGTVQLADALNIGANNLTVTNGTFTTNSYAVTTQQLSSSNSNVRTINLGASTVTITEIFGIVFTTATNLTFNAGTSSITVSLNTSGTLSQSLGGKTFYNLTYTNAAAAAITYTISGVNTFNNLSFTNTNASPSISIASFAANQTINGTLTCAGASAVRRIFLQSSAIGTQRTLTVNSLSASDCDFRDISIAGAAAGASPTRAGDCGGNAGVTFPSPKTVYWNLAGAQNWSATAWCTGSGGTPDINQFPLAQDTAVFDNTGSVTGTITINFAWNIGAFDASARTSAMTLTTSTNSPVVYGDWKFGTGVTSSSTTGAITFSENGTQTITSNGVQFGCPVTINHPSGTVQLADALSLNSARTLTLTAGTFDAVTYNVTVGFYSGSIVGGTVTTKMGSGTWTLSGTGLVWNTSNGTPVVIASTSTIVLSDTSTTARTFAGGGLYYNKLTIGGTTGTSTLTINGANTFGEIASTKTVAHTIVLPSSTTTTVGKWSVTGTAGNVVTIAPATAATTYTLSIAGPANSGIDYLSISYCAVSTTSPGEFYVGANSTNTAGNTGPIFFTAAPTPRTLYWVGGTGNWSATTSWSTSSGGASGAAIPTSLDSVNFNSASNATAYTATIDAGVTLARCASFTMAGPASGNVTFAGTVGIAFHGNVSFAATGITRTYTGAMQWAGNSSYTFTTNGVTLASACTVTGIGSTWNLGSALQLTGVAFTVNYGSFSTSSSGNYTLSVFQFTSNNSNVRSISFNASVITGINNAVSTAFSTATITNLTFNAGTSEISLGGATSGISSGGLTFYNVNFTNAAATGITITGANTFNTLSFAGRTSVGITPVTFNNTQTISTLTLNAGTAAAYRTFLASDTIGTQRTLSVGALTAGAADYDFRDIAITGAASPIAPTRAGDCKGNSGITFPAAKTVYWRVGGFAWGSSGAGSWGATSSSSAADTQFPLAQDTAVFASTAPGSGITVTINANYNIGTIDMSARTSNTMTLATGTTTPAIYGNWINGTGTTLTGTGRITFAGRGAQTITSAGKTFTQPTTINSLGGSVTLQDAWVTNSGTTNNNPELLAGTFDAASYNVTLAGTSGYIGVATSGALARTLAIGSGTWTLAGSSTPWNLSVSTNLTVTGTGTISLTNAIAKTFSGGGISYSGITLDQGGAGTLTVSGNNTFKTVTNSYSATGATSISLGGTTTTLTNPWTATGAAAKVLTVSGTSAASPATLIFSGSGTAANVDYLTINNVRAYDLANEWYAGVNSTNGGSLGWYFVAAGGTVYAVTITETGTGTDAISAGFNYLVTVTETGAGSDSVDAKFTARTSVTETATGSDIESAILRAIARITETATGTDADTTKLSARSSIAETATGSDAETTKLTAKSSISETATGTDLVLAKARFITAILESATAADLTESIKGLFAYIIEQATVTDALTAPGSTYNPSIAETTIGTDSPTAQAILISSVAEAATVADIVTAFRAYFSSVLETATVLDAPNAAQTARSAISETATGTDADSGAITSSVAVSETATAAQTDVGYISFPASVTEAATGTDAETTKYIARPTISETATGADVLANNAIVGSQITETAIGSDLVRAFMVAAARITETATGTDQISGLRTIAVAVVEAVTGTESLSAKAVFRGILLEIATLSDSVNAPGSTYSAPILELTVLQDAVRAAAIFPTAVTETATGTQTNSAAFIPYARITETAVVTDVPSALARFAARTVESATATDQVAPPGSIYNPVVLAIASALDQVSPPGSTYNAPVVVSAAATDSMIGGFLWNLIDDSQTPSWGSVDDTQTTTWTAVDDTQAVSWQNVNNSQTSGWTDVNDAQTPGWTPILP